MEHITIDRIQLDVNAGWPRYNKMHDYTGMRYPNPFEQKQLTFESASCASLLFEHELANALPLFKLY